MNKLIIPPSPNWYLSHILDCAPDNTVVYGSRNELVVIHPSSYPDSAGITIIPAHCSRISHVAINRNWGNPNKWAVSVGEDNVVQISDISTCKPKLSHMGHKTHSDKVIGAEFIGEDRVVSVSEKGFIIIWKLSINKITGLTAIKDLYIRISTISVCPHTNWLIGLGTRKGFILIVDLKNCGRVRFKIKAHDDSILSLRWCPTPYNVFHKIDYSKNKIKHEHEEHTMEPLAETQTVIENVEKNEVPVQPNENHDIQTIDVNETLVESTPNIAKDENVDSDGPKDLNSQNDSSTETLTSNTSHSPNNVNQDKNGECDSETANENTSTDDEAIKNKNEDEISNSGVKKQNKQTQGHEYLLASSCRGGRSIKIWRAGTDCLLEIELCFPKQYLPRSKVNTEKGWITLCWATPRSLLSSANKAQLLHWRLSENLKKSDYKPRLIHSDHDKYLFCIATAIRQHESADDEDWRDKNLLNAWTLGIERFLLSTSLGCDRQALTSYLTIGGTISCLVPSPIDPTRVAMAICDNTARIIDLSRPHLQSLSMFPIHDHTQLKIVTFAWHPIKELCLAFGTQEGEVGLINVALTSKNITDLVKMSNLNIFKLLWGPGINDSSDLMLYVVSNGKLFVYDTKYPLHEPTKIDFDNEISISIFAWKHDYSVLAVATKSCELLLYNNKFKIIATFLLQNKLIRNLEWHPPGTTEENWLAVGSNDVIVYDCSSDRLTEAQTKYEDCAVAIFSEHQGCVHAISWSPHQSELLASTGDFGIVLVWNVKTKTLLHACVSQSDIIYAVMWSPLNPDYLLTGGRGCVLRIWKLSENPPTYTIDKTKQKQISAMEKHKKEKEENLVDLSLESKPRRNPIKCLLNGIAYTQNSHNILDLLKDCIKLFNAKYSENHAIPHKGLSTDRKPSVFDSLDLFKGKDEISEILKLERDNHANRTTPLCLETIPMWEGNIGDVIKNAIKCDSLNCWLVSVAPMVSYNLWLEACEAYAKQLLNTDFNRPAEAAFYYLACHKVEEAIEAYCSGSFYREALMLAKTRLSNEDPLINSILLRWASYSARIGKYEISAQCYIVLNMLEEAAKILFRRPNIVTIEFCIKLAEKLGNEELLNAMKFKLNALKAGDDNCEDDEVVPLKTRMELELENLQGDQDYEEE